MAQGLVTTFILLLLLLYYHTIDNTVQSGYTTPPYATVLCDVITATDNMEKCMGKQITM